MRRALPQAPDGPRFRIARIYVKNNEKRIEVFDSEDTPGDAVRRIHRESKRTVAVDRRGYIYVDNHLEVEER
jgi:hypothetical protein